MQARETKGDEKEVKPLTAVLFVGCVAAIVPKVTMFLVGNTEKVITFEMRRRAHVRFWQSNGKVFQEMIFIDKK